MLTGTLERASLGQWRSTQPADTLPAVSAPDDALGAGERDESDTPPPDTPEADAIEQSQVVEQGQVRGRPSRDPEVPEGDALEQAAEVLDDEER
jgi:hypothetical protein